MGMKRYLCLLFACIAIFSCIPAQAAAADNGRSIKMSEITKKFDYLLSKDILLGTTNRTFDNFSYSTPEQAVNMCCKEAVGYAAQAFSAKYITGSKPNLSLPVSGPVW